MLHRFRRIAVILSLALSAPLALAATSTAPTPHRLFRVTLAGATSQTVSGRLLLFAIPVKVAQAQAAKRQRKLTHVDTSPFAPTQTAVAAMDVMQLAPGKSVIIDADALAFPKPFSKLAAGDYDVQAVLDLNHDYNYSGRGAGDLVSEVVKLNFGGAGAAIASIDLTRALPQRALAWSVPERLPAKLRAKAATEVAAARKHAKPIDFQSPALSAFWARPMHIRGWVLLPPGYAKHGDAHYPTVYYTHGYGGNLEYLTFSATRIYAQMQKGEIPPMIWVMLSEATPRGTHEFADSVNNGPWGTALTTELIPHLEAIYRMDGKPSSRFLTGHSSGGWAVLWLQVRYPKVFGGTWATSPDVSDFHDFTGADLYLPNANVYTKPDGSPNPLVRANGKVIATFKQFAQLERVLGPFGGQMASFDYVFSPRGPDGRPLPMFNRDTGKVNPKVVRYWRDHYDIAYRIKTQWPQLKPYLDGKIHVIVGTADTFYLNQSAELLKQVLSSVGANAEVEFLPGKTHMNLFSKGTNRTWLMQQIAWAMYHHARPDAKIPSQYAQEIHH